jgi:hypothetical protein
MNRLTTVVLSSLTLTLGICILAGRSPAVDDEEDARVIREARNAVDDLIAEMNTGGTGKEKARAIHEKFPELKPLMVGAFKPRGGGIGGPAEAVETWIIKWSKAKQLMAPAELDRQKEALQRAAAVARGMAEVAELYPPKKAADAAKWKRYNDALRKGAEDLARAARAREPAGVQKAVADLNGSCLDCHGDFRDTSD